jgi:hypothetical protein
VYRIYDNSKHVYTNWDPIINQRTAHPKLNPWAWANRRISYDANTCARTLAIMRRSCRLHVSASWPAPLMRFVARTLYRPNSPQTPAYRLMARLKGA